ncbi:jg12897, partial [Pararge aegeria aegeria]
WTVDAIRPHLELWPKRRHGPLTYRLVQVLTGHGCFGKYLHQIARREVTPECHECGAAEDTAQHTLVECAAWGPQRLTFFNHSGRRYFAAEKADVGAHPIHRKKGGLGGAGMHIFSHRKYRQENVGGGEKKGEGV